MKRKHTDGVLACGHTTGGRRVRVGCLTTATDAAYHIRRNRDGRGVANSSRRWHNHPRRRFVSGSLLTAPGFTDGFSGDMPAGRQPGGWAQRAAKGPTRPSLPTIVPPEKRRVSPRL